MKSKRTPSCEDDEGDENGFKNVTSKCHDRGQSVFGRYARIFRALLPKWIPDCEDPREEERDKDLESLILPSNEDWRHRVYYRLVDLQRECDAEIAMKRSNGERLETEPMEETSSRRSKKTWNWDVSFGRYPPKARKSETEETSASLTIVRGIGGSMTEACVQPGWRINDITLAAKVLRKVRPLPTYSDEAEMRRVFGLVYDVLRYKNVLNRALVDVGFWQRNGAMRDCERIVWLLLYDLQGRKFARRGDVAAVEERERIFKTAGLTDIEEALLRAKTRLAASVSRLRIGSSALNLDELLPTHLRAMGGIAWSDGDSVASGWVNTAKINDKDDFLEEMSKLGFVLREDRQTTELDEVDYAFDPFCPKIVNLHDGAREKLAVSSLVRDHRFVFLERSLCLGAAALARAIRAGRLCGPIVLTHSVAPRHTAYLAELLADIEDAGRLLAFGAGDRRYEYETYLRDLGVTLQRCRVYSERYAPQPQPQPQQSAELERATVVLAIPPCSYTGLRDIVDLAVARGGDADLLESLTGSRGGPADDEIVEQPRTLLADQLSTLKYALTRPNVQFLIYEAHTILPSETTEMIEQVVDYANRMATEKYLREHPPKRKPPPPKEGRGGGKFEKTEKGADRPLDEDEASSIVRPEDVKVPDSDLFEVASIEDICGSNGAQMLDPGCFLAVIKRRETMQFDSLFMIKVAESKGLFGDPSEQRKPKCEPIVLPVRRSSQTTRKETKRAKIEFDRIMAPTHSSLLRATRVNRVCPRHERRDAWSEEIFASKVRRARKRDARRWHRLTRTDPLTSRILCPCRVERPRLHEDYGDRRKIAKNVRVTANL